MKYDLEEIRATLTGAQDAVHGLTVEALMEDTKGLMAVDSVHLMAVLQELNEMADGVKKTIGKAYDHTRVAVVPAKMDEEGLDNMTVTGVGRVSVTSDIRASTADKHGAYLWLEEHGHGDVIQETVNAGTLKAILRRRMRDGLEIPESLFKVTPFDRASITKA